MTKLKKILKENAKGSKKIIENKNLDSYKDFSNYTSMMLMRASLIGKSSFKVDPESKFMKLWSGKKEVYRTGSKTELKDLIPYFKKFAQEKDLDITVDDKDDPVKIILEW